LKVTPASPANKMHLENQINPNTATVESLVRLPDIGIARAEAIIEYRESFTENDNSRSAFRVPDDLQNIKGIGPKIVQNMSQWLKFE
jgi:competence protein ComEA